MRDQYVGPERQVGRKADALVRLLWLLLAHSARGCGRSGRRRR